MPITRVRKRSSQPPSTASVAYASGVVKGHTIPSSGTSSAPTAPRHASVQVVDVEDAYRLITVRAGALDDRREGGVLLIAPRDEQRAHALERYPGARRVAAEQLVAATHEPSLQRAGFGVEARVQ